MLNFENEYQPTIECHRAETSEGWVFNIHTAPGAPPLAPDVIAKLRAIADRIAAGSLDGANRLDKLKLQ